MLDHTIPSRQLEVWRRLYTRYRLEPWPASVSPDVVKSIVPITNADELLERPRGRVDVGTAVGTGDLEIALVPEGVRWKMCTLHTRRATGTFEWDRIFLRDVVNNLDVIIDQFTSEPAFRTTQMAGTPILNPGDTVRVNISSFTGGGILNAHMWVIEQDVF